MESRGERFSKDENPFRPPLDHSVTWTDPKFNSEETDKLKSRESTNVLVICRERRFVAHPSIIRKFFFFDQIIRDFFEDQTTKKMVIPSTGCEIKFDYCEPWILDMFIKYLYTGELTYIDSDENLDKILFEAKNFELYEVFEYLLNCKVARLNDNWLPFLRLIGKRYPTHKDLLYLHLYTDINSSFIHSKSFKGLLFEELKSMLTAVNCPFRNEANKLEGVICWLSYSSERKAHLNVLVNLIQLAKIDGDYLLDLYQRNTKLLRENEIFKIYLKMVSSKEIKDNGQVQQNSGSSKVGTCPPTTSKKSKGKSKRADKKKSTKNSVDSPVIKDDPDIIVECDRCKNEDDDEDDDEELEVLYEKLETIYKNVSVPSITTKTNVKKNKREKNGHSSELEYDDQKRIKIEAMPTDQIELEPSSINIDLGEINIKDEIMENDEDENIEPIILANETCFKENVTSIASSVCSDSSTVSFDATNDVTQLDSTTDPESELEPINQSKNTDACVDDDDSDDDILITTPITNSNDVGPSSTTKMCSPLSSSLTKLLFFKKSKNVKSFLMTYSLKDRAHKKIAETNGVADIGIEESTIVRAGNKVFFIGGTLATGVHLQIKDKLVLLKTGSDRVKSLSTDELLNAKKALIPVESWNESWPKIQTPRYNFPAIIVENILYIFGGCSGNTVFNSVEKLDLNNIDKGWMDNEEHLDFFRDSSGAAHLGDYIYIVGGSGYSLNRPPDTKVKSLRNVERFNLKTKTQEIVASMSRKRSHVCVVAFRDKLYAIGGGDRLMDRKFATTEIYDPQRNVWEKGPKMNHPRAGGYAIILDDTIYVIGGNVSKDDKSKKQTIEMLDHKTNNWVLIASNLPTDPFLLNISHF